jgi:hypothetical protein
MFEYDYESESDNRYEPEYIVPFVENKVLRYFKFIVDTKRDTRKNKTKEKFD